jgi:hypothetical protein
LPRLLNALLQEHRGYRSLHQKCEFARPDLNIVEILKTGEYLMKETLASQAATLVQQAVAISHQFSL